MDSFAAAVDEAPTTPEVQEAVVSALVDAGFTSPEHLVGTADSVIGELAGWLAGPAGGLLKRTFRCAEDVSEAKRTKKTMTSSPQSNHLVSQVLALPWFSFYDELLRKSIATSAEWGDPSIDLTTAFGEIEKQVLEAARTRLLQTGFSRQQNQRNQNGQDANSRAKDGAEAERLVLKVSQAAKELAKQSKPSWKRRWQQCQRTRSKAAAKTVAWNAPASRGRASRRKGGRKATALSGRGGR